MLFFFAAVHECNQHIWRDFTRRRSATTNEIAHWSRCAHFGRPLGLTHTDGDAISGADMIPQLSR